MTNPNGGGLLLREYQATSVAYQTHFFEKIGVDERIFRVRNEIYGAKDFFLLSVKDMTQFGVLNVEAPKDYNEIDLIPCQQNGKSVEFMSLHYPGFLGFCAGQF